MRRYTSRFQIKGNALNPYEATKVRLSWEGNIGPSSCNPVNPQVILHSHSETEFTSRTAWRCYHMNLRLYAGVHTVCIHSDSKTRCAGELAGTATGYAFVVHGFACLVCCLEAY